MTRLMQDKNLIGTYVLKLTRSSDHEGGEALLNEQVLPLSRKDFQFLYALAHLQHRHGPMLFDPERLLEAVKALFPRYEAPASLRVTGPEFDQAFDQRLETVLADLELKSDNASGRRWRSLLNSQARRYAMGLDNVMRFELMSELRQHRDLLELMIRHYEQSNQLPALKSPAGRLYRFFVPELAADESQRRIHEHVATHLGLAREALQTALSETSQENPVMTPIHGREGESDWETSTRDGFMLSEKLTLEL